MSLEIRWLGHSTWRIDTGKHRILIDPFLSDNPAASCHASDVDADTILVSHGHFDHVRDVAEIANRCHATVVANFEVANWFSKQHSVRDTLGMNLGGTAELPCGKIKMTMAQHSSQLPDGSYGGNPGGFLCDFLGVRLFYTGDTALFSDLKLYADPKVDILIVPIGDLFTMGIEDSIAAINLIHPTIVFPTHYNTWPSIQQDAARWAELVQQRTRAKPIAMASGEAFGYSS